MKSLLATLKSKGLTILCIILLTLLTTTYLSDKHNREELVIAQEALIRHVDMNKRLSDENLALAKELRDAPDKQLPIVKEVMVEICNGAINGKLIESLPSKKEKVNEEKTADIDDRLPTDLIQLLK